MGSVREGSTSRAGLPILGALAPPVAWLAQLTILWAAEESICRTPFGGRTGFIIFALILSAAAFAVAVASGVVARRKRRIGDAPAEDTSESRDSFFGLVGAASAILFGLLIIATVLPLVFLEPCTS